MPRILPIPKAYPTTIAMMSMWEVSFVSNAQNSKLTEKSCWSLYDVAISYRGRGVKMVATYFLRLVNGSSIFNDAPSSVRTPERRFENYVHLLQIFCTHKARRQHQVPDLSGRRTEKHDLEDIEGNKIPVTSAVLLRTKEILTDHLEYTKDGDALARV